jgi:hypothetical protein
MRLDRIPTNRGSVSELSRSDHLEGLEKTNVEYLSHFKALNGVE